ncbi:hypothetical protein THAOC_14915, partial [Thalassiosira oceanica]
MTDADEPIETSVGDKRLAPDVTTLENIDFPLQRDVVCGRGGASSNHSGNIRWLVKIDLDVQAGSDSKFRRGRQLKDGMIGDINGNGKRRKRTRSNMEESRRHGQQQQGIQLPAPMPPVIADANDPIFKAFQEYQASVSEGRPFMPFVRHPMPYSSSDQQPAPMSVPLGHLATYNAQEQILQSLINSQQQQTLWNTNTLAKMRQGISMDWIGRLSSGVGQAHRSSGPSSRARVIDVSQSIESIPNDAMKLDHSNPISSLHELALLAATQKRAS